MLPVTNASATSARLALDRLDREIATLSRWSESEAVCAVVRPVLIAWSGLVAALALGPEPQMRLCPVCEEAGMRAATRCGYCWRKLTPIPAVELQDTPTPNRRWHVTR
jgi:hypothetical protein